MTNPSLSVTDNTICMEVYADFFISHFLNAC